MENEIVLKVFEGNDVYTSVVFNDLKINLKDIFI